MGPQPPIVVHHRSSWGPTAAELITTLGDRLAGAYVRIDHIGSTAIPAMPAKDVIDLQVSVTDLGRAAEVFEAPLRQLGFQRSPFESDHLPAGRVDDPASWAKRLWVRRDPSAGDVNLHVRRSGSPNERLALLFRDWFRAHPDAVPAYGRFKEALAGVVHDVETYADVKDPVVDLVIVTAESWATASGWRL